MLGTNEALIGWITLLVVGWATVTWWLAVQTRWLRKRLSLFEAAYKSATPVCGHSWCDQKESSPAHATQATEVQEGQHVYRPALLVLDTIPVVEAAFRDKEIFTDWKIKDDK